MFGSIKKIFFGLLVGVVSTLGRTKCVSLSNKKIRNSNYSYQFTS